MLSPDQKRRDHARSLILNTKDKGYSWLKGGWKEEEEADQFGLDIGHSAGVESTGEQAEWIVQGRQGMEKVTEGLGVF